MKTTKGFTIVELLIVIVVIGILAAVTIVAFNGITSKANQAKLSSDLANSLTRLKADAVDLVNAYPSSIAAANGGQGLPTSSGTTYQYTVDNTANPATFCLTATNNGTSYFVTQDGGTPTAGACPGHDNGGGTTTVTNMFTNPNFETSTAGWTNPNSSTISRDPTFYHSGGASLKVVLPTIAAGSSGSGVGSIPINGSNLVAGATYTVSAWVYVPTGSPNISQSTQGSYTSRVNGPSSTTAVKNTWVRLSNTFVAAASGSISLYFINGTAATLGQTFWIDDAMLTTGSTLFNYGDGNYTANGWSWSGLNNLSTSSGPVL